jgi:putative acetyltransferase
MWAIWSFFLASNRKLQNAVHLYGSIGFRHMPAEKIPGIPYLRGKVFMDPPL